MTKRSLDAESCASDTNNEKSSPSAKPQLKLLLHAVDGAIPYLTPSLLRRCFPADRVGDLLWMGTAVRDTCVATVHKDGDDPRTSKPRGYTFSGEATIDSWMQPYHKVTVPTFDLVDDAQQAAKKTATRVTTQDLGVSENKILLWTPNGRVAITPDLYSDCCRGLKSRAVVPLFDQLASSPPPPSKRCDAANRRMKKWWEHLYSACAKDCDKEPTELWAPVLVHPRTKSQDVARRLNELGALRNPSVKGAVLVGWNTLPHSPDSMDLWRQTMHSVPGDLELGVLSTQSMADVVRALSWGVTLLGSNLPATWALKKKAFLLDLADWKPMEQSSAELVEEPKPKRQRTTTTLESEMDRRRDDESNGADKSKIHSNSLDKDGCVVLQVDDAAVTQHPWFQDTGPMMEGCSCWTCRTHSRAYVFHLVCAKELLAEILLFIHNLHHFLTLIRAARDASHKEKLDEMVTYLKTQIKI